MKPPPIEAPMNSQLTITYLLLLSITLISCGKKSLSPADKKDEQTSQKTIKNDIDEMVYGTWLISEQSMRDPSTHEENSEFSLRLTLTIAKDKIISTGETVFAGIVICKVEAATSQIVITKDMISINEDVANETKMTEKNTCKTELTKSKFFYALDSYEILSLWTDKKEDDFKVNRFE